MQEYNVLSRTSVDDSSDEADSDDPDDRDQTSLLPRSQVNGHRHHGFTNLDKDVSDSEAFFSAPCSPSIEREYR